MLLCDITNTVSSANRFTLKFVVWTKSLMYIINNEGPNADPYGTPQMTFCDNEQTFLTTVYCFLLSRKLSISCNAIPLMP